MVLAELPRVRSAVVLAAAQVLAEEGGGSRQGGQEGPRLAAATLAAPGGCPLGRAVEVMGLGGLQAASAVRMQ